MKASELRDMTTDQLVGQLDDSKEELFNLRFQQESGQLEDFNRLREVRRNIARVKTIIRERAMEEGTDGE